MTQIIKENLIDKYPIYITIDEKELILKLMKNSICKMKKEIKLDFFIKF